MIPIALGLAAQFAPEIIKYFTKSEKAGEIAEQVIGIAQTVTGASTPEAAEATLKADPNLALQFKLAALANEVEFRRISMEETKAFIADTADARAKHAGDRGVYWLGIAVLMTFFAVMMICLYGAYQIVSGGLSIKDVSVVAAISSFIGTIVGYVAANAQQVISYFFGSSRGSNDKTSAMAEAVKGLGVRR